jgi:hypothetical protein
VEAIGNIYSPIAWLPPGYEPGTGESAVTVWHLLPGRGAFSALGHFGLLSWQSDNLRRV